MAELIQDMVHMAGYETEVAFSGFEGLDKVREGMPDLILVDLMMPDMDGWEVYHKLREFSSIPVIFVTAYNTPQNQAKAASMGADGFIGKDLTPMMLAQQIQFVLDEQGGKRREYLH
jgi:CheY-like chemotaxis protein